MSTPKRKYKSDTSKDPGLGFTTTLTLIFVVLKLTDNIDWSWWWVLSPIWIVGAILITFAIILLIWFYFLKKF